MGLTLIPVLGTIILVLYGSWVFLTRNEVVNFVYLMILARMLNPVLYPSSLLFELFWWFALVIVLLIKAIYKGSALRDRLGLYLLLFCYLLSMYISVVYSINPEISFIKASIWTVITILLLFSAPSLDWSCDKAKKNFKLLLVCSLPFYFIPSIGYARDGLGFQGLLNHPQAFAVFIALFFHILWKSKVNGKTDLLWLLLCLIIILSTRARTGLIVLLGPFLMVEAGKYFNINHILHPFRLVVQLIKNRLKIAVFAGLSMSFILFIGVDSMEKFIMKSEDNSNLTEAFEDSRGFILLQQIENFSSSPWVGIGFGVAKSETHAQELEKSSAGIPVGASTEKSNVLIAVLEETGIIGFVFFAVFIVVLLSNRILESYLWLPFILSNISEVTFFSYGSFGLIFGLIMVKVYGEKRYASYIPS